MPPPPDRIEAAFFVWERELGQPYRWGGDTPSEGWDCSGLVVEALKSVGLLPRKGDWTAETLFSDVYRQYRRIRDHQEFKRGMLVFWAAPQGRMRHVEIVWARWDTLVLTLGAAGGGSGTTTRAVAEAESAYVKIRPLAVGWTAAIDPFQEDRR